MWCTGVKGGTLKFEEEFMVKQCHVWESQIRQQKAECQTIHLFTMQSVRAFGI